MSMCSLYRPLDRGRLVYVAQPGRHGPPAARAREFERIKDYEEKLNFVVSVPLLFDSPSRC